MKKPDKLFQLIKSLTKTEKRYFKLHASPQKGGKQYMRLFDAIDAQEVYDEASLTAQFAGERLLRQLNVAKNYLYQLILRSLRTYHARHGTEARILELLRTALVLHEKGLDNQASEFAAKAALIAERHEEFALLVRANCWEYKTRPSRRRSQRDIEEYYSEQFRALDQQRDMLEQAQLLDLLELHRLGPSERTVWDSEAEVEELIQRLKPRRTSVKAEFLHQWSLGLFHYSEEDLGESIRYAQLQRNILESNPEILNDYPIKYFYILNNLAQAYRMLGDESRFREILDAAESAAQVMLSETPWRTPRIRYGIFKTVYVSRLAFFISAGMHDQAVALAPTIEAGLLEHEQFMASSEPFHVRLKLAGAFLAHGEPDEAVARLCNLMNGERHVLGTELESQTRFMHIIAHFEAGHDDLIEYLVRSAYRSLRSRNMLGRFETTMLHRLRRLTSMHASEPDIALFNKWLRELQAIADDPVHAIPVGHFDFMGWLRSKIEGSELLELAGQEIGTFGDP